MLSDIVKAFVFLLGGVLKLIGFVFIQAPAVVLSVLLALVNLGCFGIIALGVLFLLSMLF